MSDSNSDPELPAGALVSSLDEFMMYYENPYDPRASYHWNYCCLGEGFGLPIGGTGTAGASYQLVDCPENFCEGSY